MNNEQRTVVLAPDALAIVALRALASEAAHTQRTSGAGQPQCGCGFRIPQQERLRWSIGGQVQAVFEHRLKVGAERLIETGLLPVGAAELAAAYVIDRTELTLTELSVLLEGVLCDPGRWR